MQNNKNPNSFFEWLVSLFKKEEKVVIPPDEKEVELAKVRAKYRLEYEGQLSTGAVYCVQYLHNNRWYFLRRWEEDYSLETVKDEAIRLSNGSDLNFIIELHQQWLNEGHISMTL